MSTTHGAEALTGTLKNGQVLLDSPAHWPEGCRVLVMRATVSEPLGATGDEQADDPESVERWIAAFDAIPPLEMTAEEEERWRSAGRTTSPARSPALMNEQGESRPCSHEAIPPGLQRRSRLHLSSP